ncbi:LysR family transcriptional regulator [Marinobacter sp. R17]|uniref:LysR family transcriptional regulator n=1 Tax=Marinobacter sp. R17 TaxID=2484250 RepID=UPI001CC1ED1E|nr:LysR family transcriptional regulator [Marinobacter sp. R17]
MSMHSLENMAVFAAVVEQGSFSAAADWLGLSTPVVSKRVSALEKELAARLLHRTTRKLSLTEAGSVFYRHCARIVSEAREAGDAVAHLNDAPRGLLRVTAPINFGTYQLADALPGFLARYPEIEVEMEMSDRQADLAAEGFDLAIRLTSQPPENLAARHLTASRRTACASPEYWARHGKPVVPSDLTHHNCIIYSPNPNFNRWYFNGPGGLETISVNGNFRVNNTQAMVAAALGGVGVLMLTSFTVDRYIRTGALEPVLTDYTSPETDVYALYLPTRHLSTKARVFIDFLVERYQGA